LLTAASTAVAGANGLANPRDFESPVAAYEDRKCSFVVVQKFLGMFIAILAAAFLTRC